MLSINLFSSADLSAALAARVKARRLDESLTQEGLAVRAGVSLGSLKRFERTGLISLDGFLRLVVNLGRPEEIEALLQPKDFADIDDVLAANQKPRRVRGRRR